MSLTAISAPEQLRLFNLAYRHVQRDARRLHPDLFRTSEQITADSNSYILLPTNCMEVEYIENSEEIKLEKIDLEHKKVSTGWYNDGIDTTTGKRRLMVRKSGATDVGGVYTVYFTIQYNDLTALSQVPVPFSGTAYLDMLSTLQAYYYYLEQGVEKSKDAKQQFEHYGLQLEMLSAEYLDDEAEYGITTSNDAGQKHSYPILNASNS